MSHAHKLEAIYWTGGDMKDVVRWCSECGAVVVDKDVDGRTYPGKVMPMRFPSLRGVHLDVQALLASQPKGGK